MSPFKRKKLFKNLGLGCGCASTTNSNATYVYEPKPIIPKIKPRSSIVSSSNDEETYISISPSTSSILSSNWHSCNNENIDKKMITTTTSASAASPSASRRWNMEDQKRQTTDSISTTAVVMESENPYDDFQQSMLEMITENQIFSAEELLQLLHCFLSLNSPAHHHLILCAFFQVSQYAIVSSSN
ncbi:transcription repressor OFP7-like [Chenopodium quinoa]|uniref:Transcription repressor n=1 Tax=Chenopodium quinoa TaxID=63459 RepID=A0A803LXP6_CHEQI|nr:transcription repressor OFP7-like [Chenopodium quinoa]